MRKIKVLLIIVSMLALLAAGCTTTFSVGGASMEFGRSYDSKTLDLIDKNTTFRANETFYYRFDNGGAFKADMITIQLIDSKDNSVILKKDFTVKQDSTLYVGPVVFNQAGKYKVVMSINGSVKASGEVIIQ